MSLNQQFYNDAKSSISGASNFIENNSENVRNYGFMKREILVLLHKWKV